MFEDKLEPDDICPACQIGILELKKTNYPFYDYYLKCDCCDITFELNNG